MRQCMACPAVNTDWMHVPAYLKPDFRRVWHLLPPIPIPAKEKKRSLLPAAAGLPAASGAFAAVLSDKILQCLDRFCRSCAGSRDSQRAGDTSPDPPDGRRSNSAVGFGGTSGHFGNGLYATFGFLRRSPVTVDLLRLPAGAAAALSELSAAGRRPGRNGTGWRPARVQCVYV
eukprot:gene10697-biopygen16807